MHNRQDAASDETRPAWGAVEAGPAPLMLAQLEALRTYARDHGRTWKTQLRVEWMNATAPPLLHHLRNTHGPVWLEGYVLPAAPVHPQA